MSLRKTTTLLFLSFLFSQIGGLGESSLPAQEFQGPPWKHHVIDDSSEGADGVRLKDVNGDQLPDIATGWEEGGEIHICLHPGKEAVRQKWPKVVVGNVKAPEDAVFADLDQDGMVDVISCCEGKTKAIFIHWAPGQQAQYQSDSEWETMKVPGSDQQQRWMFSLPMQIDGKNGVDLVAGGKGEGAEIGWWEIPPNAREVGKWRWHALGPVGWLMSLHQLDLDQDGDQDIVLSDRRGPLRGCRWLENPGAEQVGKLNWTSHFLGGTNAEVMFMEPADLNGDDQIDFVAATKDQGIMTLISDSNTKMNWKETFLGMPEETGSAKAVQALKTSLKGAFSLIVSCEHAKGKQGLFGWELTLDQAGKPITGSPFKISGKDSGIKYDRIELIDLDQDGDLDVLTCEERDNLGVLWYENPRLPDKMP